VGQNLEFKFKFCLQPRPTVVLPGLIICAAKGGPHCWHIVRRVLLQRTITPTAHWCFKKTIEFNCFHGEHVEMTNRVAWAKLRLFE
jgi:hypothetical protein